VKNIEALKTEKSLAYYSGVLQNSVQAMYAVYRRFMEGDYRQYATKLHCAVVFYCQELSSKNKVSFKKLSF